MSKKLEGHTENGFVRGFGRFFVSDLIIESKSWEILNQELEKSGLSQGIDVYYNEYRVFNVALRIQHLLCEIIGLAYQRGYLNNEEILNQLIIKRASQCLDITEKAAEEILQKETVNSKDRFYTPHVLLYVAGFNLGQLIKIFRECVRTPEVNMHSIADKLTQFNTDRNILFHNLFSSRISFDAAKSVQLGKDSLEQLENMHSEYLNLKHL